MKRPRFRLTLTFWLLTLVALAVVFAICAPLVREHFRKERQIAEFEEQKIRNYRTMREWGNRVKQAGGRGSTRTYSNWGRMSTGPMLAMRFEDATRFSSHSVNMIAEQKHELACLEIENCPQVTDQVLAPIAAVTTMRALKLNNTSVGSDGLLFIAGWSELEWVCLNGTQVDGRAIAVLATLPKLRWLELRETNVTNEDLVYLQGHPGLEYLDLTRTQVSDGLIHILATIPNLVGGPIDSRWLSVEERVEISGIYNMHEEKSVD